MKRQNPKKTVCDTSTQSLLKTARLEGPELIVTDRAGNNYAAFRTPDGHLCVRDKLIYWSGLLLMDEWSSAELAWWEEQIDALTPANIVWLVLDDNNTVVGHVLAPELLADEDSAHPFRTNNAAGRALPALGAKFVPPPVAARPRRYRGAHWAAQK